MDKKEFGVRLKELLKERGIKQKEVAVKTGMSRQCVSAWVNGERLPSIEVLVRLSKTINVDIETLLGVPSPKTGELTANEYQLLAMRTCNIPYDHREDMLRHAVFGLNSEAGEVAGIIQKQYQLHPFDKEHMMKELGDCAWMLAEACTALGVDFETILRMNIEKLQARFPDGFSADKSLHRAEGDI